MLAALALLATSFITPAAANSTRDNLADFDFVTTKVRANYSGWETKTAEGRGAELESLTKRLRVEVAKGNDEVLRRSLQRWIAWFDDGHLQVQWAGAEATPPWRVPARSASEVETLAKLSSKSARKAEIEGFWTIDDRYRLAVVRSRQRQGSFDAIVLTTNAEGWKPGDVKAVLTPTADGAYDIRYGAGDRTEVRLKGRLRSRGDVLEIDNFGVWRRVQDDPGATQAALHRWPGDEFELSRIDADTLYLRLPSFGDQHVATVRNLLASHAEELATTANLIIDIRGNGGGSDFVYDPVLPLIYTRPIWRPSVDIRVSPDNMRLRAEIAERIRSASPEAASTLASESDRMRTAATSFIRREPAIEIVRLAAVLPSPARVAVLIDRAGSSAENFIMDARQSRKVTLMGQENSAGVIDFGEMMSMNAPSGRFALAWATTRSLRLPQDPVDPAGIAPDVLVPRDADDPVRFAAQWLGRDRP